MTEPIKLRPNRKNLTGLRFGKLTAISFNNYKNGKYYWNCICECGTECIKEGYKLEKGFTKSCGCLRIIKNSKHSDYKTRLYRIYNSMKYRCSNPTDTGYKWYGARGIKVCEEWLNNYQNFKKWAFEKGYNDTLSIERIDNDGNYEPNNCKWIPLKEQPKHTRKTKQIKYNGKTYTMNGLAKEFNINRHTLYSRLKNGWSIEKALIPPRKYRGTK